MKQLEYDNNEASIIINKMIKLYRAKGISDLAKKINMAQPTLSKWRINNSTELLKKKCKELGIYDDIFNVKYDIELRILVNAQLNAAAVLNKTEEAKKKIRDILHDITRPD